MKNKIDNNLHSIADDIMNSKLPKTSWVAILMLTFVGTTVMTWTIAGFLYYILKVPSVYVLTAAIFYQLWGHVQQYKLFKEGLKKSFLNKD